MKKLELTAKHIEMIRKFAEGIDVNTISAYECITLNTLPVTKNGVWDGARTSESALMDLAKYVQNGASVPIHQIHDQPYSLPVGKTFHAETVMVNGLMELRSLFYVDNAHEKLISGLETSSIDEVSIGYRPQYMLCSECGWDYAGEEATMEHFWTCTCENGHTIGKDGVHLNLSGVVSWNETSLVSRGAAKGAKILGRTKSLLGESEYNRLAASGIAPDARMLFASPTFAPPENPMDLAQVTASFTAQLGTQAAALGTAQATVASQATQLVNLKADLDAAVTAKTAAETAKTAAEAAKTAAETALTAAQATDAAKELKAAQDNAAAARTALFDHATKLAVAAGGTKPVETASVQELVASMTDSQAKLSLLPVGGVSNPAASNSGQKGTSYAAANFVTRN